MPEDCGKIVAAEAPKGALQPERDASSGKFLPGHAAYPSPGRPKSLATYIKEQTNDGRAITDFMLAVMEGRTVPISTVAGELVAAQAPKVKDRVEAAEWLADRAFGKAALPITGGDGGPLQIELTNAELKGLVAFAIGESDGQGS